MSLLFRSIRDEFKAKKFIQFSCRFLELPLKNCDQYWLFCINFDFFKFHIFHYLLRLEMVKED